MAFGMTSSANAATPSTVYDVAIVGTGLVGLSAALALAQQGLRVALVGTYSVIAPTSSRHSSRIYALSPANQTWLEALRVWSEIPASHLAPVYDMKIFDGDLATPLHFSAYQATLGQLAWIVSSDALTRVLTLACRLQSNLHHFASAATQFDVSSDSITLALADNQTLTANLVVGADGAQSMIRQQAGITIREHDYQQTAVVANFCASQSHVDTAYQWFRDDGILALLPLPDQQVSMVWSTTPQHAQDLLSADLSELGARVAAASQGCVGALTGVMPAAAFPLRRLQTTHLVAERVALIGDAAHVVHPLAGQGMNLGLQDAYALTQTIQQREVFRDCGDARVLTRYARARAAENWLAQETMDGLQHLFTTQQPLWAQARQRGMVWLNRLPRVKAALIRRAAGI